MPAMREAGLREAGDSKAGSVPPLQPEAQSFFVLQMSLVERVCRSPDGFEKLSDAEKLYYALTLLQDEVNNGGFHQFFFNSSGSYFDLIDQGS